MSHVQIFRELTKSIHNVHLISFFTLNHFVYLTGVCIESEFVLYGTLFNQL